jgi:urease accessory protein
MLIFSELLAPAAQTVAGELRLSFEWRQKSRFLASLVSGAMAGQEIGVRVPRGHVLREGDLLGCREQGELIHVIRVRAAAEQLLQVTAKDTLGLTRIAYHLGNRHVPVQVGPGQADAAQQLWLRLQLDHVLENMVEGLGGEIQILSAPFDPESGAYGHGHSHAGRALGHDLGC